MGLHATDDGRPTMPPVVGFLVDLVLPYFQLAKLTSAAD
jgi:hypothetical protein